MKIGLPPHSLYCSLIDKYILRSLFFFVALLFGVTHARGQGVQTYAVKYDLDFMRLGQSQDTWASGNFRTVNTFGYSPQDSIRKVYGAFSWDKPLDYHLWKSLTLPHTPEKNLSVEARISFPSADSVSMITYRLEKNTSNLRVDTTTWRRPIGLEEGSVEPMDMKMHFSDNSTSEMQIHLVVYLPNVEAYDSPHRGDRYATGILSGVDVFVDGKSIRNQVVKATDTVSLKVNSPIQHFGSRGKWDFSVLKVLGEHRVLALGETMHFNPALQEVVRALGVYLVKEKGTSLILSEGSLSMSLMNNRYINDESYKIPPEYVNPLELNTLKTLREECQRRHRPIHYLGFDISFSSEGLGVEICTFLYSLPRWSDNIALCHLVDKLMGNASLDGALEMLRTHRDGLLDVLREEEFEIIEYMLLQNKMLPREGFGRIYLRDKYMAENARFLVNRLSPDKHIPVLLYAHLGHLALRPMMKFVAAKPCGAYLKEWYGRDLYSMAMLTSGGETRVDKGFVGWGSETVATMPEGTFEAVLERLSDSPYFMETPEDWNQPYRGRLAGTYPSNSSIPFEYNLYQQSLGLLFIPGRALKESEKQALRDASLDAQAHIQMMKSNKENLIIARQRISDIR